MAQRPVDSGDTPPRTVIEERHSVPPAEPRADWRSGYLGAQGLIALLGLWLIASPFVLNYRSDDATWNPIACGVLMIIASAAGLTGVLSRAAAAVAVLGVAAWLFAGAFWLADSAIASWSEAAAGALAAFLAIAGAAALTSRQRA